MIREEEIKQAAEEYYNEVKYLSDLSAFPIAAFKAGAEWADKTMLDIVCEWIEKESFYYIECEDHYYSGWLKDEFYTDLRKAMKGE